MQLISYQIGDDEGNELYIIAASDKASACVLARVGTGVVVCCGGGGCLSSTRHSYGVGPIVQIAGMSLEELAAHLPDAGAAYSLIHSLAESTVSSTTAP